MYGALGALVALQSPVAQHVDVSAQAAMTTVHPPAPVWWDIAREEHARTGPFLLGRSNVGSRFRNLWACADGFVSFAIQGGPIGRHTGRMLAEWMAERGTVPAVIAAIDWERFDNTRLTQAEVDELEAAIAPFLRSLTKAGFFDTVAKRKMRRYPVGDACRRQVPCEFRGGGHPPREPTCRRRISHDLSAVQGRRRRPRSRGNVRVLQRRQAQRDAEPEKPERRGARARSHPNRRRLRGELHARHRGAPRPRSRDAPRGQSRAHRPFELQSGADRTARVPPRVRQPAERARRIRPAARGDRLDPGPVVWAVHRLRRG